MLSKRTRGEKAIKRTVSLHPNVDAVIRVVQATMIENGWNTNYSEALNTVVTTYFYDVARFRGDDPRNKQLVELTGFFLNGKPIPKEEFGRFSEVIKKIGKQYLRPNPL